MTTPGDRLRGMVERMIIGRPGEELGNVLGGEGDVWIVSARDVDWSDPGAPEVEARFVQGYQRGVLWTRMAASNPDSIQVTGYPCDDGSRALIFDWEIGTRPVHQDPLIDITTTPHGVTLFIRE